MEEIQIVNTAIYLHSIKTLVLSDLHIGFEEALNKQGILVPRFHFKDTMKKLSSLIQAIPKPKRIIINGDLKHEFGTISVQEWRETLKTIGFLDQNTEELLLIKGNHDTILGPIAEKRNVKILDYFLINEYLFIHGHKPLKEYPKEVQKAKTIIIGHEHPAITLQESAHLEKYKCLIKGKVDGRTIIALPSFNPITEGTDVLREKRNSPLLPKNLKNFEAWIIEDKPYYFGKLKDL